MRFGVRLPGPFFATFGRTARGQARRNLSVRAHERDILAGNRTAGEEAGATMRGMFGIFILLAAVLTPFVLAWMAITHVANHINPDLHWGQTFSPDRCTDFLGGHYPVTPGGYNGGCPNGGDFHAANWHY